MAAKFNTALSRVLFSTLGALTAFTAIANDDRDAIAERIAPVGQVSVKGQPQPAAPVAVATPAPATPAPAAPANPVEAAGNAMGNMMQAATETATAVVETAASAAEPAAADSSANGKSIYDTACFACHAAGVLNAPKLGDKAAWAPRIAQGDAVLLEHALKGFKGMPPKGGAMHLADADIKAAIGYMVSQGQ